MTTYALDTTQAKQAEYTGSRIDTTGKYVGKFTRAEDIKAKSGAVGIEFDFESSDGRKARMSIYTKNRDGDPIFGQKMLMAIMTCLKVRDIQATVAKVKKYNLDAKKEEVVDAPIFGALQNKPIGLLLQAEEYEKQMGGTGWKMNIVGCFDPSNELTASEILDKKTKPEQLAKMVAVLRDKPLRASAPQSSTQAPARGGFDDMADDIPF